MDDAERLRRMQAGDSRAWDEGFTLLYPVALAAARQPSVFLDPEDAEEVAVEALQQLVSRIAEVAGWDGVRAFVFTIAARKAVSRRRELTAIKRGGGRNLLSLDQMREEEQGWREPAASSPTWTTGELVELGGLLREALAPLDDTTRGLIRDFIAGGLRYKELSEKYRLPLGTVGVFLTRGLGKVRAKLAENPRLLKELEVYLR